jgi:phage/plasmid-like protein (TIGR03299 family)
METAGFDFEVEKVPVHTPEGDEVPGHFLIRRQDTKYPFACMRKRYNPIPMEEMLKPFHTMVSEYGCKYENAGLIRNGRKCWISAKFDGDWSLKNRPDDKINNRIMALIGNDGSCLNSFFSIANRIFCNNQLHYIQSEATKSKYGVRHTKNWKSRLEEVKFAFFLALENLKEFQRVANKLDDKKMSSDQARGFATMLFPSPERKKGEETKEDSGKLINRRESVVDLFAEGAGNRGLSRWDALNAVTEFLQHHNNANRLEKHGRVAAERQLVSNILGGPNDILTRRATRMLLEEKQFKALQPVQQN